MISKTDINNLQDKFTKEIETYGRIFLLDIIDRVNLEMITCDFLTRLNAIRYLIRKNVPDNVSDYYLNKLLCDFPFQRFRFSKYCRGFSRLY